MRASAHFSTGSPERASPLTDGVDGTGLVVAGRLYPGRARHIHVKVRAPGGPVLTTQLYFPGEAENRSDSIFDDALLMDVRDDGAGRAAAFDFVLER